MAETKDWQSGLDVGQSIEYLYERNTLSDVVFNFPGNEQIRAHKIILGMRSSVFEAMFYGAMAEVNNEVTITDIERHVFNLMLR